MLPATKTSVLTRRIRVAAAFALPGFQGRFNLVGGEVQDRDVKTSRALIAFHVLAMFFQREQWDEIEGEIAIHADMLAAHFRSAFRTIKVRSIDRLLFPCRSPDDHAFPLNGLGSRERWLMGTAMLTRRGCQRNNVTERSYVKNSLCISASRLVGQISGRGTPLHRSTQFRDRCS
jgi:hypothetical protein